MKLKSGLISHKMNNEFVTVAAGEAGEIFNGMIRSNAMAMEIMKILENECSEKDVADAIFARYDAPYDVITRDVHHIIEQIKVAGLLDE